VKERKQKIFQKIDTVKSRPGKQPHSKAKSLALPGLKGDF